MTERKIVSLSLSADRRVVDEIYAARFLSLIKVQLQNPEQLI